MFWDIPCVILPLPSSLGKTLSTVETKSCDVFPDLYAHSYILTGKNNFKIPGKQFKGKNLKPGV